MQLFLWVVVDVLQGRTMTLGALFLLQNYAGSDATSQARA